tara:strand:- start:1967 stop:2404 length:438 start_codon:yes stop_codon:yes gene_type:complete
MSGCWLGPKIKYHQLGHKEKESFNAAHLMAVMAKWGYLEASRINGDKHGADLLFYRSSDGNVMKVQLKGRVTLDKKYTGKELYIAFPSKRENCWYVYPHDAMMNQSLGKSSWFRTKSWKEEGGYSWNKAPRWLAGLLSPWKIPDE